MLLVGAGCGAPSVIGPGAGTDNGAPPDSGPVGDLPPPPPEPDGALAEAVVTRVIDGDTVEISGGTDIRIIGIDTPETKDPRKPVQCFGVEATAQMKKLVEGKVVRLEINPGDELDKHGRDLRYLMLGDIDVGAEMIRDGYAFAYRPFPHVRMDQYVQLEADAKAAKRGLWAPDTCAGDPNTGVLQNINTPAIAAPDTNPTPVTSTPTSAPNPTPAPAPPTSPVEPTATCVCPTEDKDCGDFSSHAAAQAVYDCCMQLRGSDVHRLDGNDNDGLACESI